MAETEERPSKMRKLHPTNGAVDGDNEQPLFADVIKASEPAIEQQDNETGGTVPEAADIEQDSEVHEQNDTATPSAADSATPTMSKSQLKKLRKKAQWDAGKDYRKQQKKAKEAAKRAQRAAEKAALLAAGITPEQLRKARPIPSTQVPVTLLLDCDFDSYMTDKEIMSLGQQITRSYSDNKHARYRAHLVISSFGGKLKERYETVLANHHLGWKGVVFSEKFFVEAAKDAHEKMIGEGGGRIAGALLGKEEQQKDERQQEAEAEEAAKDSSVAPEESVANGDAQGLNGLAVESKQETPKSHTESEASKPDIPTTSKQPTPSKAPKTPIPSEPQVVYLSSDSENTLTSLSPYTTYIIGGIVDKNRHKGLCQRRATELGISTAKLPIGEYMQMQSRTVLATNHVVEIMVNWLEKGDWGEAFLKAIPKRKEAVLRKNKAKQKKTGEDDNVEDEDEDEDQDEDAMDMEKVDDEIAEEGLETHPVPDAVKEVV